MSMDAEKLGVGVNAIPSGKGFYANTIVSEGKISASSVVSSGQIYMQSSIRVPKITKGTGSPSGGSDGDIYIKYSS